MRRHTISIKRKLFQLFVCLSPMGLCSPIQATKWLPESRLQSSTIRLLACTYDGAMLKNCTVITNQSDDWQVTETPPDAAGFTTWTFLARKPMTNVGVAVAFDQYHWCTDNYVMIPASVYNGNRQRIVNRAYATGLDASDFYQPDMALTSNPIPQLSPDLGKTSLLEVSTCNASAPCIACFDRHAHQASLLFTDQGFEYNGGIKDNGLFVEESADRSLATFVIAAPGVRQRKPEFIGFSPSPDRGVTVKAGDKINIRIRRIDFPANDIPALLHRFLCERKTETSPRPLRNLIPMGAVLKMMDADIDERYYTNQLYSFYCPENANWMSYGWIGGLINTYPMLALNDKTHLSRVVNTFNFALLHGFGHSGYYNDVIDEHGNVLLRDGAKLNPGIGLTRKNADLLYWTLKQFNLLRMQNRQKNINPEWEQRIHLLADAFVHTWRKQGTWGNYLNLETGDVAVYNTDGGAMAVGGLALASVYFNNPEYLKVALEAGSFYYNHFALVGFTSGGCGDILQNADSETSAALTTSLMTLYEITGDRCWLQRCADAAALLSTWTTSYAYRLPAETPLAKLNANLTGAVWASTQNKHGAPGICTQSGDALFKLYRATGDTLYAQLLRDIIHAHAEGIQPNGKITERLTYCDADSRGSRLDGGRTGWTETNGALMALEIPGIYINVDTASVFVFDHVVVTRLSISPHKIKLTIHNPTSFNTRVTWMAENRLQARQPLGDNAFVQRYNSVKVEAGCSATLEIFK